ncbi:hypothetical protein E2C01_024090 [Portunus trituberculatus]|uniref:Uncharacterized protein n=1 Tax=Portunus trituberculatus TaxID=210409 RepID=A0A5B7E9N3_PORTR|nr:hypothetical protein [Portunus trituberculatus]
MSVVKRVRGGNFLYFHPLVELQGAGRDTEAAVTRCKGNPCSNLSGRVRRDAARSEETGKLQEAGKVKGSQREEGDCHKRQARRFSGGASWPRRPNSRAGPGQTRVLMRGH